MILSYTAINKKMHEIRMELWKKTGSSVRGDSLMYPLVYYVNTGRASAEFLKRLINAKTFMIVRKLQSGGSDQEIMKRIKKYLDMEAEY